METAARRADAAGLDCLEATGGTTTRIRRCVQPMYDWSYPIDIMGVARYTGRVGLPSELSRGVSQAWHLFPYRLSGGSNERQGVLMILGKLWHTIMAQINKVANLFWTADPIAQMQYEYDLAVAQLKEGREGLEQYRALVERVSRQVTVDKQEVAKLEARVKAYLSTGDRTTAARFAMELQKAKQELAENEGQLEMHEKAYNNNVKKIKNASKKLTDVRTKIAGYDAELKMSRAEAEMAKLATSFNFDVTTDFGQIEQVLNEKISLNRAKVRVAADLSSEGIADIEHEEAMEAVLAEQALKDFEVELGLVTPDTTPISSTEKELGPAETAKQTEIQR